MNLGTLKKPVPIPTKFVKFSPANSAKSIDVPIPLPDGVEIEEYFPGVDVHVRSELAPFVTAELQKYQDEIADAMIEKFLATNTNNLDDSLSKFEFDSDSSAVQGKTSFAEKFCHVMHNSTSAQLMSLVRKEVEMETEMSQLIRARKWEIEQISQECESILLKSVGTVDDEHPHQLSKLNERMRRMYESYSCQIEALAEQHRKIYRKMVEAIHSPESATESELNHEPYQTENIKLSADVNYNVSKVDKELLTDSVDESFTFYIGAQLKSMHNARLLSSETLVSLCDPLTTQNYGLETRLQMAMSLYGRSLTAMTLIVPKDTLWHINSRSDFSRVCERSSELHFESLATQLSSVSQSTLAANSHRESSRRVSVEDSFLKSKSSHDNNILEVGDVYLTHHSNLLHAQIIFHLVSDDSLQTTEISSRHPCLNGIRNIIRMAASLGISTLYIPLLLIDKPSESTTTTWCLRRAEMIFKCVKGYLIEVCSTASGGSAINSVHYNINFVLPAGLSPSIYHQIKVMLPTIFHPISVVTADA